MGGAAGKEQLERSDFSREAFTWSPFIYRETRVLGHLPLERVDCAKSSAWLWRVWCTRVFISLGILDFC